jgi:hypothetical protein
MRILSLRMVYEPHDFRGLHIKVHFAANDGIKADPDSY